MFENNDGTFWWVIGYIKSGYEELDLPIAKEKEKLFKERT